MDAQYITLKTVNGDLFTDADISSCGQAPPLPALQDANVAPNGIVDAVVTNGNRITLVDPSLPGDSNLAGTFTTYDVRLPDPLPAVSGVVLVNEIIYAVYPGGGSLDTLNENNAQTTWADPRYVAGAILRIEFQNTPLLVGVGLYIAGGEPTQQDQDAYVADLLVYNTCVNSIPPTLKLITNREGYADKLRQAFRLRRGACVYDLQAGFPWEKLHGSTDPVYYSTLARSYLNSFDFVSKVLRLDVTFDLPNRSALLSFEIETPLGESVAVTFNTEV